MADKRNAGKGHGREKNNHATYSARKEVGAGSTSGSSHVPMVSTSGSRHMPGSSSSSSKAGLNISTSGRVLLEETAIVDWLDGLRSSQGVDSSQGSVDSTCTTLTWHTDRGSGFSLPSALSSLPPPSAVPHFLRHSTQSNKEDYPQQQHSDEEDLCEHSQLLAGDTGEKSVGETQSCWSKSGSGSCGGRVSHKDEYGEGGQVAHESSEVSGRDDEDYDDALVDRMWEPADEDVITSTEVGNGGTGGEKEPNRGRANTSAKRPRGRSGGMVMSKAGDCNTAAGASVGSRRKPAGGGASLGGSSTSLVRYSAVWQFFCTFPEEPNMALCRICKIKISRGQGKNVGTTSLRRHMEHHHRAKWDNRNAQQHDEDHDAAAAPLTPCHLTSNQASSTGSIISLSSSSMSSSALPPTLSRQLSIAESIATKQQYAPSHPVVVQLNSHLAKLLAMQSLPFHMVESTAFRQLMACAQPRWRIPSRHYFSKKAIPALINHVEKTVAQSLKLSVCSNVHFTVDTWTSNCDQGQYMSFTAHWVNILQYNAPPQPGQTILLTPPRLYHSGSAANNWRLSSTSTSSSTDVFLSQTGQSAPPTPPPSFYRCNAKRCHAVLHLLSLFDKSHTGPELLNCINEETSCWVSSHNLSLGNVVADNANNIVAALHAGGITHALCIAHVINLVVKSFFKSYVGLNHVLAMSRRVCIRFSRSHQFRHELQYLQQANGLPEHRLICDVPTRWNSTLHMLDRLYTQRRAVNDFLVQHTGSFWSRCHFEVRHWQMIREACRVLRPFEEATRFVSRDNTGMNDVMPLIFFLEQTLKEMMQQGMEEELHLSCSPVEEQEMVEEEVVDEEEDLDMELSQGGKEEEADTQHDDIDDDNDEDDHDDDEQPWQYGSELELTEPSEMLARMASCMLCCLRTDKCVNDMKDRDDYWIATLLDPRYKSKMGDFFPPSEREAKLSYYQNLLCILLVTAFEQQTTVASMSHQGATLRSPMSQSYASSSATTPTFSNSSISSHVSLESRMRKFLYPLCQPDTHHSHQRDDHHLNKQVKSYLDCALSPEDTLSPDPMDFWVSKLEHWQELAQYALGILSCPPSSVASERVFSTAGGIVSPKKTRLSDKSVEKLTFVKMNQAWIREDFKTPFPDATD